jgi:hypothetical protein
MTAEVGAGQSADDINAVADPAWLSRIRTDTDAEPFLDEDGAVVIPVTSGSGFSLEGAPPDRTIKLPNLGAHQARVTAVLGPSTLQRVIISAHERLEELAIASTPAGLGRIDDLTINATRDDENIEVSGRAYASMVRLRGGRVLVSPGLIDSTTVIDLRDTIAGMIGASHAAAAQLRLSGSVQVRSTWTVRSSHITPDTIIKNLTTTVLSLGIVNPQHGLSDPPFEVTLRSPGPVGCEYLPPASRVHLEQGRLHLEHPGPPSGASLEDEAVARFLQAPPTMIDRLTIIGAGHITAARDLESPTFTPKDGELELHVAATGNVLNAAGRVVISAVEEDTLCQGSAHIPLVVTRVGTVNGAELERINIYDLSVGDVRRLQPAARVTPWIPNALEARRRELAMRLGTDNAKLQAERRADFWTKLAAILSTQQVLGSTQSNVRLASMRARRRALPWGRERFWLSAFSLIGYGERITLPLLWWLGGVVAFGLAHATVVQIPSGIASRQFAALLLRLALGPLAILRVDELRPPNAPGPWDTLIWIAALILGTICLGFALVAIRKVTRAAH